MVESALTHLYELRSPVHRMAGQIFSERPDGAGDAVALGDDGVKTARDPIAVSFGNHECRQELDGMAGMTGDLAQQLMVLEQRDRDELAEQTDPGGFESMP